ncbi:MAG: FliO/MopB family protein [Alphaproteobacteria bacterium]|nr:FliO/MopB family protein [Alphaproteobacteria bacterium]
MTEADLPQILRVIAALAFVLALMGGLTIFLRKYGFSGPNMNSRKRLKLVETLPLDSRRRLAIVQCDEKQHLVILGPNSETVIESNIESRQDNVSNLTVINRTNDA